MSEEKEKKEADIIKEDKELNYDADVKNRQAYVTYIKLPIGTKVRFKIKKILQKMITERMKKNKISPLPGANYLYEVHCFNGKVLTVNSWCLANLILNVVKACGKIEGVELEIDHLAKGEYEITPFVDGKEGEIITGSANEVEEDVDKAIPEEVIETGTPGDVVSGDWDIPKDKVVGEEIPEEPPIVKEILSFCNVPQGKEEILGLLKGNVSPDGAVKLVDSLIKSGKLVEGVEEKAGIKVIKYLSKPTNK